ncbi:MAG TPA: molybdate ABC transporter substrate-binding protein [Spongiibacteraceae bacterium]|nr:molybdate ABC transporter substrate-binding protein [Spongiibacteraceae bacterium]
MKRFLINLFAITFLAAPIANADELRVAVAANFLGTLQKLAPLFETASGHHLLISGGASGQIYTQITQGAPYDLFLSADKERPQRLEAEGLAVAGSGFTYATGKLVLWSPTPGVVTDGDGLKKGSFKHLAIANPKNAPYGAAAQQVLTELKLWDSLNSEQKIVMGESIAQAQQYVVSGNAELGFLALAQVIGADGKPSGSWWLPPQSLYKTIDQDAIILKRTEHLPAAQQFMQWLRTNSDALDIIKAAGYSVAR